VWVEIKIGDIFLAMEIFRGEKSLVDLSLKIRADE